MNLKRQISLVILFTLLMSLCSFSGYAVEEVTLQIDRSDVVVHVTAESVPGWVASVVILKPDADLGVDSDDEVLSQQVAYLGQAVTDENGKISVTYYLPALASGNYTLKMGNCWNASFDLVAEFFAATWGNSFQDEHIFPMYNLEETGTSAGQPVFDYEKMAAKAKETLSVLPDGRRFVHVVGELQHMVADDKAAQNYIWWDNGAAKIKTHMEGFLEAYKAIDGKLDGVVVDFETGMSRDYLKGIADGEAESIVKAEWNANKDCTCKDFSYHIHYHDAARYNEVVAERRKNMAKAIAGDERFADLLPELTSRGFVVRNDDLAGTIENLLVYGYSDSNIYSWDVTMGRRVSGYLNTGIFDVVTAYYPDASGSDYGSTDGNSAHMFASNGHPFYKAGNGQKAGTHSSTNLYGKIVTDKGQFWADESTYTKTGFSVLKYDVNMMKTVMLSEDNGAIQPWIANPQFAYRSTSKDKNGNITSDSKTSYTGNTPWYREMVFHVGLLNPDPFLYWGPRYYGTDSEAYVQKNAQMQSDILEELNAVAGYRERMPLTTEIESWNTEFVLTGMQVGDSSGTKNIWRITPNLEVQAVYNLLTDAVVTEGITGVTRENFCIDSEKPTFKIAGTTITFPQGTIIADKNIIDFDAKESSGVDTYYSYEDKSYGYWVETPAGVMPTVKYDSAYYTTTDTGFATDIRVFKTEDGRQTEELPENGGVTVRLSYKNHSGDLKSAAMFLAAYSGEKLLHIHTVFEGDIQFGEDGYKLYKLDPMPEGTDRIQLLLWDGVNRLCPLGEAIELN